MTPHSQAGRGSLGFRYGCCVAAGCGDDVRAAAQPQTSPDMGPPDNPRCRAGGCSAREGGKCSGRAQGFKRQMYLTPLSAQEAQCVKAEMPQLSQGPAHWAGTQVTYNSAHCHQPCHRATYHKICDSTMASPAAERTLQGAGWHRSRLSAGLQGARGAHNERPTLKQWPAGEARERQGWHACWGPHQAQESTLVCTPT